MTTLVDTNILIALWDTDPQLNAAAQKALDFSQARGALVITGAVYAELLAYRSDA
jgi:predicted nucleic acid-binding protein